MNHTGIFVLLCIVVSVVVSVYGVYDAYRIRDCWTYRHVSPDGHPRDEVGFYEDLIKKWEKYGTLYIGVDFDNTLVPYGNKGGEYNECIVELLRTCKEYGMKLCLWSLCDSKENMDWKLGWCREHGIEMDYINESPLLWEWSKVFGKPHFNILLDDVAGLESAYSVLYNVCEYIWNKRM